MTGELVKLGYLQDDGSIDEEVDIMDDLDPKEDKIDDTLSDFDKPIAEKFRDLKRWGYEFGE